MSDSACQRARRECLKVEASRQGKQVLDTNVPSTSTSKFDVYSISDNINVSISSDRIETEDSFNF